MKLTIEYLQQHFGSIPGVTIAATENGLAKISVRNNNGSIAFFPQGAQLTSYCPTHHKELIWLSNTANFKLNKPIRGGAPICWPWFGQHPTDTNLPQHGFARTAEFQLEAINHSADGSSDVLLRLSSTTESLKLWPFEFQLDVTFHLAESLSISITTHNLSNRVMPLTQAIHSYFKLDNIEKMQIKGLSQCNFFDKVNQCHNKQAAELLSIQKETDRIYYKPNAALELFETTRKVAINHQNSDSTVIWNPWQQKAQAMLDFDDEGYQQMICVESAATSNDLALSPSDKYQLIQIIRPV